MRLSDEMNFPHPVLASWRDDFSAGVFEVDVAFQENVADGQLDLNFTGRIESPAIESLISNGDAMFGCFVTCASTGMRRLIELGGLPAKYAFAAGDLLDTVVLRPIIWLLKDIPAWRPPGVHEEFDQPQSVHAGDIVAMAEELVVTVEQFELPALETIFDLKVAEGIPEGEFEIDLTRERITILAGPKTKHLVDTLRGTTKPAAAAVMNGLYVPAVMTVLTEIGRSVEPFEQLRWFEPFMRRCQRLKIEPPSDNALGDAQRLLDRPFPDLRQLVEADHG